MAKHMPPVPPAGRAPRGGDDRAERFPHDAGESVKAQPPENLAEQDHQGNISQNTTRQGNQQDR